MLQVEQHPGLRGVIALIHENGAAPEQIAMSLYRQVERGVEQRMAGADEGRQGLARRRHQRLVEGNALVARKHGFAEADETIAVANRCGYMGDLVSPGLALSQGAAQLLEGLHEKRFDVVRLQTPGVCTLHLIADFGHARRIQRGVRQRSVFDQGLKLILVDRTADGLGEPCLDIRTLAIANGLDQQFSQRLAFEDELSKHVEYLSTQGLARLLQFLQQGEIDLALARLVRDQIPEVANLGLADAMDPPESLFQAVRVPGQVVVDHQVRTLKVDAFASRVGGHQHLHQRIVLERFLRLQALLPTHTSMDDLH